MRTISIFNNKGGVGKTSICWNVADALGRAGKTVLLIDFDPQCNLSIAMLGETTFVETLPTQNKPYGTTIRAYLQRFLQGTGGEEVHIHSGRFTSDNVRLVAGDFWLNVYSDSLNVGADLLTGTGLSRYVALRNIISQVSSGQSIDYVLLDLPPSFGALVRAAFYASDYYIVPCTSDNFSVYCVGLIGQMVPAFIRDWQIGLERFREANPHFTEFDEIGRPVFAGWIFNGFDTARERRTAKEIEAGAPMKKKKLVRADATMQERVERAVRDDLAAKLRANVSGFEPVISEARIGAIEDANVLIQNSLWLNVPIANLDEHEQVVSLYDRQKWAPNQIEQIQLLRDMFDSAAARIVDVCA